jgi:hypothetical protein
MAAQWPSTYVERRRGRVSITGSRPSEASRPMEASPRKRGSWKTPRTGVISGTALNFVYMSIATSPKSVTKQKATGRPSVGSRWKLWRTRDW